MKNTLYLYFLCSLFFMHACEVVENTQNTEIDVADSILNSSITSLQNIRADYATQVFFQSDLASSLSNTPCESGEPQTQCLPNRFVQHQKYLQDNLNQNIALILSIGEALTELPNTDESATLSFTINSIPWQVQYTRNDRSPRFYCI